MAGESNLPKTIMTLNGPEELKTPKPQEEEQPATKEMEELEEVSIPLTDLDILAAMLLKDHISGTIPALIEPHVRTAYAYAKVMAEVRIDYL